MKDLVAKDLQCVVLEQKTGCGSVKRCVLFIDFQFLDHNDIFQVSTFEEETEN
jgi:hypothetical protein